MQAHGKVLRSHLMVCALAVGALAATAFLAAPEIDLISSRAFQAGGGAFAGQSLGWVNLLRNIFVGLFFFSVAAALGGLVMTRGQSRGWLRLSGPQWMFLVICLAVGPGIVANVVLKDHWGRARPKQVLEFGGAKAFTPPLIPTDQCAPSCRSTLQACWCHSGREPCSPAGRCLAWRPASCACRKARTS
jgi:lipid A 4'-phosphatase